VDPEGRRHHHGRDVPHVQHGDGLCVCCPEGFGCEGAEDGEGLAGGRERGERARGVVRGEGDNVARFSRPPFFTSRL